LGGTPVGCHAACGARRSTRRRGEAPRTLCQPGGRRDDAERLDDACGASLRRDRELVALAREVAFELVDPDPLLADQPILLDELRLLFSAEDEAFLFKS